MTWRAEGPVGVVTLDDPTDRNTFTPAFRTALVSAVTRACADPAVRVLLVRGRPELFCAGGRREDLERLSRGEADFDEDDFFQVFASCPLPVVAEVQGHAIGGGLAMTLHADLLVLSERSLYWANFMHYGFTPGMAATALVPACFGEHLGVEMLYTGRAYRGAELRDRGAPVRVLPHGEVPAAARATAEEMARAPRRSLELLKGRLGGPRLTASREAVAAEVAMHRACFGLAEVRERIGSRYGAGT
ncbi:polyketide synthase [Streptomyces bohaiensis]|uniref:Enoyl-CoA hydratase n=1 Tax=Streptomyces bohaiensis TaxID=1431344 RepID=A0ABX1C9Y8_9ACTN|nr:polyketide synthase [Streptomyces bohaiensis]NJQ14425.1 hypothetical protein [Streptomyces bohaiensis]